MDYGSRVRNQLLIGLACASVFVVGCEDDDIRTDGVDKAKPATQSAAVESPLPKARTPFSTDPASPTTFPMMTPRPAEAAPGNATGPIPWTVPQAWERAPGDRPMPVSYTHLTLPTKA